MGRNMGLNLIGYSTVAMVFIIGVTTKATKYMALLSIDWLVVVVVIVLIVSPSLSHGLVIIFTVVFLCPRPHPHHCVWESLATIFKPEHECLRVLISLNLKQEPCLDLCASGGKDGVTLLWDLAQVQAPYHLLHFHPHCLLWHLLHHRHLPFSSRSSNIPYITNSIRWFPTHSSTPIGFGVGSGSGIGSGSGGAQGGVGIGNGVSSSFGYGGGRTDTGGGDDSDGGSRRGGECFAGIGY
ncbi:hypothetical protein JHK85_028612 [Glycine max]|nr:hypothetical protein JHK85_028612 [Glycine max]